MRNKVFIILLLATLCLADTENLNSFNSGEMSPYLEGRADIEKYYSGCRWLENYLPYTYGAIQKRPGTKYIKSYPGTISGDFTPCYPTLQELTAAEIPTKPTAPSVTAADTAVGNATELQAMSGSTKYYLTGNIDLTGVTWTPIVNFAGVLDGRGFTISNLTINTPTADNKGLFANFNTNAQVYDLTLDGFTITGDDNIGCLVGLISNKQDIIIKDVIVTDSVVTGHTYVGGLVGEGWSNGLGGGIKVNGCSVTGTDVTGISGSQYVGGMLGELFGYGVVTDCYSTGGTIRGFWFVGGLTGNSETSGLVSDWHTCYSTNAIVAVTGTGTPSEIGGFGGKLFGTFTTCYATGSITHNLTDKDPTTLGGFAGFWEGTKGTDGDVINCYSTGTITITTTSSGGGTLVNKVGGFIGKIDIVDSRFLRCYSTGDINIENTTASGGDITTTTGGWCGIIAATSTSDLTTAYVKRCWTESDIHMNTVYTYLTNNLGIGGFIGTFSCTMDAKTLLIENCYTWTSITADGAQVGQNAYLTGGFISGLDAANKTDINCVNCYVAQTETKYGSGLTAQLFDGGLSQVGGFSGLDYSTYSDVNATACYWDTTTSSITADYSVTAVGHVTSWMMTKSNYEAAGWDFDTIWVICEGTIESVDIDGTFADGVRLIPFEYSTDDAYVLVLGNEYMGFFRSE